MLTRLVKKIVLGVSDGEAESVTVGVNMVDLEDLISSTGDSLQLDIDGDTLAGNDNIGETVVGKLGPSRLSSESKGDVSNVTLDLRKSQSQDVRSSLETLVDLRVRREFEVVVSGKLDNVGEQVGSGKDQVLNDQVDLVIRVLGSRNGDVTGRSADVDRIRTMSTYPTRWMIDGKRWFWRSFQSLGLN